MGVRLVASKADTLGVIRVCMCAVGLVCLSVGAGLWWPPAGLIALGAALLFLSILGELVSLRAGRPVLSKPVEAELE